MPASKTRVSPSRQQYLDIKRQYPDTILFYRLGDFYETFDQDAETVARELDIVLTSRKVAKGVRVPMAGVPHHAAESYIARLIAKGYHVAICEQIGDEPVKGLFHRKVVRVVTPGTVVEPGMLATDRNNYLAAAVLQGNRAGVAYVDITTGVFAATQLESDEIVDAVRHELARLGPTELLTPEGTTDALRPPGASHTGLAGWKFEEAACRQILCDQFQVGTLAGFGVEGSPLAVRAAGAVLHYLGDTQQGALDLLTGLATYSTADFMQLDPATRASLELTETIRGGQRRGSLLGVLDYTVTPMGARLLRHWVNRPLLDVESIRRRLNGVSALHADGLLRASVRESLKPLGDLERLVNRVLGGTATPRDLGAIRAALQGIPPLKQLLQAGYADAERAGRDAEVDVLRALDDRIDPASTVRELLEQALVDDPPANLDKPGVIRRGWSAELDGVLEASRGARDWIAALEPSERKRTGIKSLKVGYNKVFGYYVEVTKANASQVPKHYVRKQTLVNAERYITPELKEYETLVLNAEEQIRSIEQRLFSEVCQQVGAQAQRLLQTARMLARLDVAAALAEAAARHNYVRPEVLPDDVLELRGSRHPVVEELLPAGERFVPNDAVLAADERVRVITGPNMSGKCVRGDTLLFTDRGLVQIDALLPAQTPENAFAPLVCTVQGRDGVRPTSHIYNGGLCETVRIRTGKGFAIEGTTDHRIWVRCEDGIEGWKRLGEIVAGDVVAIERRADLWGSQVSLRFAAAAELSNARRYRLPSALNSDLAYLLGLLLGDGTLTYKQSYVLTSRDAFIADEFKRIVLEQFNYNVGVKANGKDHFVTSTQLRTYLAENGLGYHNARSKRLPDCILRAPRRHVVACLQGLFDADGYADDRYGNVRCSTSSKRLARELQLVLLNLGIVASLRVRQTKGRPSFRLSIDGEDAILFHEIVGFRLPRKRARRQLASNERRPNKGGISHLNRTLRAVQARILAKQDKALALKHAKAISSIFYTYIPSQRNISHRKLDSSIDYCRLNAVDCRELEALQTRRYFYDAVERVRPGRAQVYDLTVPDGPAYIANGFVSHNSTYLRQVALCTLMAQIGSFVPAESARIGVVDRIFTRIGAQDEIHAGQSTFMVEMVEAANILHHATSRSLLILDEIGRGTSTYDGLSLAWAILEYIHNHPRLRAKTFFATHYHELVDLAGLLPGVRNYNVAVAEEGDNVVFLHQIVPGGADRSYGIHVAQLAGLPRSVIKRAEEILASLEKSSGQAVPADDVPGQQMALFPETSPLLDELAKLDVATLTPLEALNKLYEWQRRFGADPAE